MTQVQVDLEWPERLMAWRKNAERIRNPGKVIQGINGPVPVKDPKGSQRSEVKQR